MTAGLAVTDIANSDGGASGDGHGTSDLAARPPSPHTFAARIPSGTVDYGLADLASP